MKRRESEFLARRLEEIRADNAAAARSRVRCKTCGCSYASRCVLALADGAGLAQCAPPDVLEGSRGSCSACLTPELRVHPRTWFMPDDETLNEMIRLGLARPVLTEDRRSPR